MPTTTTAPISDRNTLAEEHLYLLQHAVNQLAARYPRHIDRGELWSAGAFGLVDASRRYDPAAGVPFARYAAIRIRGAIIDSTRSRDWATRSLRRDMRAVGDAVERFEEANGRTPAGAELAATLGISEEQLHQRRRAAAETSLLQLDQPLASSDSGEATIGERLVERTAASLPDESLERAELVGTVRTAVAFLPDVQREVVERCFFGEELLRDIADSLGVTEARVSQIRTEALNAMRAYFGASFDGVPDVPANAPGLRRRANYVAAVAAQSSWRTRLQAGAQDPAVPSMVGMA